MKMTVTEQGRPTVIEVDGRIDTTTAPEFTAFVDPIVDAGADDVTIDLSRCDFVSSAGLRAIVALQKRLIDGRLVFTGVSHEIMEVFTMTGFDTILTFG